jgi:hypothetical protein
MTSTLRDDRRAESRDPERPPAVDVVIPVYNEAHVLDASITRLHHYLRDNFPLQWRITVADNGSTDDTWQRAQLLAAKYPNVIAFRLEQKGRGRALRAAWSASDAQVVAYMDVDLSTDLGAFLPLVAPLLSGHSDVAIGSRLSRGARVVRGVRREVISRCYNRLLRLILRTSFRDAQCGFKAVRTEVAQALLPSVHDQTWFFDTEFLVMAERLGLRIAEVPVDWTDDPDSRVQIIRTAVDDLRGIARLAAGYWLRREPVGAARMGRPPAEVGVGTELVRSARAGVVGTLLYLGGFCALQPGLGPYWANGLMLTLTVGLRAAAAPQRWGDDGGPRRRPGWLVTIAAAYCGALGLTSGALLLLHLCFSDPGLVAQAAVATATSALAVILTLVLVPGWLPSRHSQPAPSTPASADEGKAA